MKIVPNTDPRVHVLTCSLTPLRGGKTQAVYQMLPVVAWEAAWNYDESIQPPLPVTIRGYMPSGYDHRRGDAVASLLYYPHEGKYGDGLDPFEVVPMLSLEQAKAYLVKACRACLLERQKK